MRILFDFDDVLNNLSECWVKELNRTHGLNVDYKTLTDYSLEQAFPMLTRQQIYTPYLDGTLYLDIAPKVAMQELIRRLAPEHELFVVSANIIGVPADVLLEHMYGDWKTLAFNYLVQFVNEYYPEINTSHIVVTSQKYLLNGDILIDDNPEYLRMGTYKKILVNKSYNQDFNAADYDIIRVNSAQQIENIILEMEEEWI